MPHIGQVEGETKASHFVLYNRLREVVFFVPEETQEILLVFLHNALIIQLTYVQNKRVHICAKSN